jgi:hypothetical protein
MPRSQASVLALLQAAASNARPAQQQQQQHPNEGAAADGRAHDDADEGTFILQATPEELTGAGVLLLLLLFATVVSCFWLVLLHGVCASTPTRLGCALACPRSPRNNQSCGLCNSSGPWLTPATCCGTSKWCPSSRCCSGTAAPATPCMHACGAKRSSASCRCVRVWAPVLLGAAAPPHHGCGAFAL